MLELLALRHKEWVDMARAVGCPEPYAEDVVQEVYIRLYNYRENIYNKLILPDDEVNTFYMFVSIRNMVRTMMKNEGVYINYEEFYYEEADGLADMQMEEAFSKLIVKMRNEANSWGRYHSKLFNVYYMTDFSMRDIADGTGISLTHIYNNLKTYKKIIIDKYREDYEDFKNQDYDKL
jgi:DNA-directed RNA polymerase specialized sigma24 family protein